jgi:type II secretory ATPase GspE/PulE/Tfp pilus assembly ATPase PilB-like protein/FixJ family two-component response regulator
MSRYNALFTGQGPSPAEPAAAPKAPPYEILLVDDEPNVLKALMRVFRQENYRLRMVHSAEEALAAMAELPAQLVVSDYKMPGMNGGELLKRLKAQYPDTVRIMLTGHADVSAVMTAIQEGAVFKFILKPWNDDDLRVTVGLALEQYELRRRNRELQQESKEKSKEIASLAKLAVNNRSQLAILLHKRGLLNAQQVQELFKLQQTRKEPLIRLLLDKQWVEEKKIREILAKDLLIQEVQLAEFQVDAAVAALVPYSLCEKQLVAPLKLDGRKLLLAMADPMDQGLIDDLRFTSGLDIQAVMADAAAIKAKLADMHGSSTASFEDLETLVSGSDPFEGIEIVIDDEDDASLEELLRGTDEPPAIRLANSIILEAVRLGASDIHIHPRAKSVVVRYRIDGILADKIQIPYHLHQSLVSRIKVMAELDITERRRPQDGRLTVKTPFRVVDLRISCLATINGEKIVMRVLDRNASIQEIGQLGFASGDLAKILHVVGKPQGIVLATGPTGSGKTTTLYSLLQHNASPAKNYVTIEDPVEYYLDQAGQILIREKAGLNFPLVLRAILRQDPDVILLGEIRDEETAEVAFHAALTGHMVYSTLHTNSAIATISRLFDLGLKPYVLATALEGIIAQRLVRRVCADCREPYTPPAQMLDQLGPLFRGQSSFTRGKGCPSCHGSGYRGRLALYEVLTLDDSLRHLIATSADLQEITRQARALGVSSLIEDAQRKAAAGLTTPDEILRVLGPQEIAKLDN